MPLPIITIPQMREWEQATWRSGQTEAEVMRRVGLAVAQTALEMTEAGDLLLILAGNGNNGEDARLSAPHLENRKVKLVNVADAAREKSAVSAALSAGADLVIDGLFGIGLSRKLSKTWIELIESVNAKRPQVLSVDVPSGLNADTGEPEGAAIRATRTLTVGAPKAGLLNEAAWEFVGQLEVADDTGLVAAPFETDLQWVQPKDFADFPPRREVASHKGTYGHLAIVAGTLGYHGAAVLAARAAQRAQPGLISLFTTQSVFAAVAPQLQAVMVHPLAAQSDLPRNHDAILIGPGLANPDERLQLQSYLRQIWKEFEGPVIVDASGLDWIPPHTGARGLRIITPHPGEASRLLGTTAAAVQKDREGALRRLSETYGDCLVVLKGHQTMVGGSKGPVCVNSSGNPYLAQGGSGDALAGFIAGHIVQPHLRRNALHTLAYAVWQHGAVADCLQKVKPSWTVEELTDHLGSAAPQAGRRTRPRGRPEALVHGAGQQSGE